MIASLQEKLELHEAWKAEVDEWRAEVDNWRRETDAWRDDLE
jgi:hypothetical protein